MFNLTVAEARTFFVGDGAWLVHNACDFSELRRQAEYLRDLGATRAERKWYLSQGKGAGKNKATDHRVIGILPDGEVRTSAENSAARLWFRNSMKREKFNPRTWWERRNNKDWPDDADFAEHPRSLSDGGHPWHIEPGFGDSNAPHNIVGPDGLTDSQRFGRMGTPAREANKLKKSGEN